MTLELEEAIEVAQIAAIITENIDFNELYKITKGNYEGYIGTTYFIGEMALQFYLENKDSDWEERLDDEGCWDDIIITYAKNKIDEYERTIV